MGHLFLTFFLADKYFCSLLDKGMAQNLDLYGVYFCRGWDRSLPCAHFFSDSRTVWHTMPDRKVRCFYICPGQIFLDKCVKIQIV